MGQRRDACGARRVASLCAAALVFWAAARSAAANEVDQDKVAPLTFVLNGADKGEVTAVLRHAEVWVPAQDLDRAGLAHPWGRTEVIRGKIYVSLGSLGEEVAYAVDTAELTLRVDAPIQMLAPSTVDLAAVAPVDIEHRRDASLFFNYAPRLMNLRTPEAFFEAGASVSGHLLFSSASFTPQHGLVRGMSNLTIDDRDGYRRYVIGDSFVSGGELGGGFFTGGLTVTKTYELDPYFRKTPPLGAAGSTLSPSTLDVYVDGVLVRRQPIAPGPFRIENLPVQAGGGTARYVVRDAFGRESAFSSTYYASAGLLAEGLSEYTYSVGLRRVDVQTKSFAYGGFGALATHRVGLSSTMTAGVRIESAVDLLSGGPSLTTVLPFGGQLDLAAAASAAPSGGGLAGLASYTFTDPSFSAGVRGRLVSDRYSTLSLDAGSDRANLDTSAFVTAPLGRRFTVGSQYGLLVHRDAGPSFRVGLSTTVQLESSLALSVTASRTVTGGRAPFDAFATLVFAFGEDMSATASHRFSDGRHESVAQVNKSVPPGTGAGFRATAVAGQVNHAQVQGIAQWQHGRYSAILTASETGRRLDLEAAGGIVILPGVGAFFTRPIEGGFGVIRVPNTRGVRGYLNNQEIGRTDADGNLVIPNLLPYYGNRLSIGDSDLPVDYSVEQTERVVAPPLRGAAIAEFRAKPTRYFRGRVVVSTGGRRAPPSYGELAVHMPGASAISPIGKEGEFEIEGVAPGTYPATVTYTGGKCAFRVVIPTSTKPIANMGTLLCTR